MGTAGGAEAAAGAGAGVERGEGGAGAILETKGGTGVTRGIAKGQGQGLEAAAEAVEEPLICRPLDAPHYLIGIFVQAHTHWHDFPHWKFAAFLICFSKIDVLTN